MYTIILTFDKNENEVTPCICYAWGRQPALFFNLTDAHLHRDELAKYNPGCVYEVKELKDV